MWQHAQGVWSKSIKDLGGLSVISLEKNSEKLGFFEF
jgi:hypothetical protein